MGSFSENISRLEVFRQQRTNPVGDVGDWTQPNSTFDCARSLAVDRLVLNIGKAHNSNRCSSLSLFKSEDEIPIFSPHTQTHICNHVLSLKIEGPFHWYTIYHHLPIVQPPIFNNQPMGKGHLCVTHVGFRHTATPSTTTSQARPASTIP